MYAMIWYLQMTLRRCTNRSSKRWRRHTRNRSAGSILLVLGAIVCVLGAIWTSTYSSTPGEAAEADEVPWPVQETCRKFWFSLDQGVLVLVIAFDVGESSERRSKQEEEERRSSKGMGTPNVMWLHCDHATTIAIYRIILWPCDCQYDHVIPPLWSCNSSIARDSHCYLLSGYVTHRTQRSWTKGQWSCCQNHESTKSSSPSPILHLWTLPSWEHMVSWHKCLHLHRSTPSWLTCTVLLQMSHLAMKGSLHCLSTWTLVSIWSQEVGTIAGHHLTTTSHCQCVYFSVVAVVGPNGIGKSTFLNLLIGRIEPVCFSWW